VVGTTNSQEAFAVGPANCGSLLPLNGGIGWMNTPLRVVPEGSVGLGSGEVGGLSWEVANLGGLSAAARRMRAPADLVSW
jgi:hypothetical protein